MLAINWSCFKKYVEAAYETHLQKQITTFLRYTLKVCKRLPLYDLKGKTSVCVFLYLTLEKKQSFLMGANCKYNH